ncbi:MAG: heat-inducible transcriptional repressor HrcA [Clostridiales bacterium]|jgi:heat-inducible transcriptional repressor|nr:heat-inducible transcriptional repressor HrcA [Clostridiales bacterium]
MPELSKRKKEILKAVIDDFIATANPVSSQDIKDKHLNEVSSATIRSELAALEEMGYLTQPHISAGRVPSNAAYKLYASELMQNKPLTKKDIEIIKGQFDGRLYDMEEVIKKAAKIISDMTNYTSVVLLHDDDIVIRNIKLVELIEDTALIVIITNKQVLKDSFVTLPKGFDTGYINTANELLNSVFTGKNINDLGDIDAIIDGEISAFRSVFDRVMEIIKVNLKRENIVTEGEYKILEYPDNDRDSARKFINIVQKKDNLNGLINESDDIQFSVKIGREEANGLDNCAVVSAKYTLNGKEVGRAGVIGPVRMDYGKVYSVLNYVCKMIDEMLKN